MNSPRRPGQKKRTTSRSTFQAAGGRKEARPGVDQTERIPDGHARGAGAIYGTILGSTLASLLYFVTGWRIFFPGDFLFGGAVVGFIFGASILPKWVDFLIRRNWWPF